MGFLCLQLPFGQ